MREFLATKVGATYAASTAGGTIAGNWANDLLVEGTVAFIEGDGAADGGLIPATGLAGGHVPEHVKILIGRVVGRGPFMSNHINRSTLEYHKKLSVVHQHGQFFLGRDTTGGSGYGTLNSPSAIAVGDLYGFQIIDLSKSHEDNTRYRNYETIAQTGDTLTIICNRLATMVTTDPNAIVSVSVHLDGGAVVNGFHFIETLTDVQASVNGIGNLANATIIYGTLTNASAIINGEYYSATTTVTLFMLTGSVTTPAVGYIKSEGNRAQLLAYEQYVSTEVGNSNTNHARGSYYSEPSMLDTTTIDPTANGVNGWCIYTLNWINVDSGMAFQEGSSFKQKCLLAIPSADAALIGRIDVILASL